ncbi:MAG: hypothetical protein HKN67_02405 [Saprospiraceae bacterium]|nr:hypothetical protein [Bacteroidia bacterium]NNF20766.1 hypothetical protein [Saprospiraceae bacterium]
MQELTDKSSRAQISRAAIQRLHISMRHLFTRGSYKPLGISGEAMINSLLALSPEIYGSISDTERVELNGLLYIFQRLPQGIEECRFVKLISREGYQNSQFPLEVPLKRRRNCYRIDDDQIFIEMTRGRSDIYDVLTHLTFMYIEAEKIRRNALDSKGRKKRDWVILEKIISRLKNGEKFNTNVASTYLSTLLGRTYEETSMALEQFENADKVNSLFQIVYWLGYHSIEEYLNKTDREISFSSTLREKVGHHIFGERWAQQIKALLEDKKLLNRPIHIISSNLHSVINSFYAASALKNKVKSKSLEELAEILSSENNQNLMDSVRQFALKNGMYELFDNAGTNIGVQVFDLSKISGELLPSELTAAWNGNDKSKVVIVMDYAFGEQAYECMDELLKPYTKEGEKINLDIKSISIMGKAGILEGKKGDIMIPDAHIFEGSADNYVVENNLTSDDFSGSGLNVYKGPMITVLGTSLQNKDILRYFLKSSWNAIGLEMEGAHYQKAIQAASKIRHSIDEDIILNYAYYASDNPLETGSTLASGGLGVGGVKPTYLITLAFLKSIFKK